MNSYIKRPILFIGIIFFSFQCFGQSFKTTVKGKIEGKKIDSLYIFKATEDYRANHITVPIVGGEFEHTISTDHKEAYEVYFPSHPADYILFFVEPATIRLILYPGKPNKNSIEGGQLTDEYYSYLDAVIKKFQNPADLAYQQMDSLSKKSNSTSTEPDTKLKIKKLKKRADSLTQASLNYQTEYIANHTTIVSYFWLFKSLNDYKIISRIPQYENAGAGKLKEYQERYAKAFPSHPYSSITETQLGAIEQIRVGNRYKDFKAPDLQGNQKLLSTLIDDKIVLLNLWASWCGPCIRKSRNMIPIYKKYNGEEFTIIGVAREFGDTSKLEKALKREEFPWENLVDLDDKYHIWRKYDIPQTAGGMFLIGKDGNILAIDPMAKEVRKVLENRL